MKRYNGINLNKKGSIVVEAAIFLPIFLIALLTLGLFIRQAGTEETVFHTMLNQGRLSGINAYSLRMANGGSEGESEDEGGTLSSGLIGLGSRQLYGEGLWTQLEKELGLKRDDVELRRFRFLYEADGRDQLIEAVVRFQVKIPLPKAFIGEITGENRVVLRAFVGKTRQNPVAEAGELEEKKESCTVYVFPREGERYHRKNCVTITSTPVKCILNGSVQKKYEACDLCCKVPIPTGSIVLCYRAYGQSYHRSSCSIVEKYVVEMEQELAEEQGYTPCRKCGGV